MFPADPPCCIQAIPNVITMWAPHGAGYLPTTVTFRGATRNASNLSVFISYSRQDIAFVDRLQQALAECGIEAFVDREHIEKAEAWWARITDLITNADTITFVLSPGSVDSKICKEEIAFAERLRASRRSSIWSMAGPS